MPPGRNPKLTVEETVKILRDAARPFWSVKQICERTGVTKPTAKPRLDEAVEQGKIAELEAAGASIYYLPGKTMKRIGEGNDPIKTDLRGYWNDRFVGDPHNPSVVSTMETELTAGNEVVLSVNGWEGDWYIFEIGSSVESVQLPDPEMGEGYSAVICGELYAKPTVPIEHIEYHDDRDLESKIGGEYLDKDNLVAAGRKNYQIKPCNNALFLQDVTVEKVDGPGPSMDDVKTAYARAKREPNTPTKYRMHDEQREEDNKALEEQE